MMRLFDTMTASEQQIIRCQCKQLLAHARLFREEVIPSIPTDDDDLDVGFVAEEMPRSPGKPGPVKGVPLEHKRERKQRKRGAVRVGPRVRHKAQAPVIVGAADIEPKRRPEIRGK